MIGIKHHEIGLDSKWYIAGYAIIKAAFAEKIMEAPLPMRAKSALIVTLEKYVAIDMALALSAYSSWLSRLTTQPVDGREPDLPEQLQALYDYATRHLQEIRRSRYHDAHYPRISIGTKLGITAAVSMLLVTGMIVAQVIGNSSVRAAVKSVVAQQSIVQDAAEAKASLRGIDGVRDIRLARAPGGVAEGN